LHAPSFVSQRATVTSSTTDAAWHVQELKLERNDTELEVVRSQYANVTALLAVKRKCVLLSQCHCTSQARAGRSNNMHACRDVDEAEAKLKAERVTEAEVKKANSSEGAVLPHLVRLYAARLWFIHSC